MKIFLLASFFLLFSCQKLTPEEDAQKMIGRYLELGLKNYDSYQSIEFGPLDPTYSTVKSTTKYQQNYGYTALCKVLAQAYLKEEYQNAEQSKLYADSSKYYAALCDSLESIFVPEFIGLKMQHVFQTKNDNNVLIANKYTFLFDDKLRVVTSVKQVYSNLPIKTFNENKDIYGIQTHEG